MSRRPDNFDELVRRACELRTVGRTTAEIATELAVPRKGAVIKAAVATTDAAPRTLRMRAKDEARERAVTLRREGWSYGAIARDLRVSKGTLSLWLVDEPLSPSQRAALLKCRSVGSGRGGSARRRTAEDADAVAVDVARDKVGDVTSRELSLMAAVSYWCEGAKSKPWRRRREVSFANSDVGLIRLMLAWFESEGIARTSLGYRLYIHEHADVAAALAHWSESLQISTNDIRVSLKRHNPVTRRRNTGPGYVGCLTVKVRKGADVYRQLMATCQAIFESLGQAGMGTSVASPAERL